MFLDLLLALRQLGRTPFFSAMAVGSLAIGIGATTAVYAIVDATVLRPLRGVEATERLVAMFDPTHHSDIAPYGEPTILTSTELRALQAQMPPELGLMTAHGGEGATFARRGGEILRSSREYVDGGFFTALGLRPAIGRLLTPEDDEPGAPPTVVLSDSGWQKLFGRDVGAIGKTIVIDDVPFSPSPVVYTVVGVAPRGFRGVGLGDVQLFVPLAGAGPRPRGWLYPIVRLAPGVEAKTAETVLGPLRRAVRERERAEDPGLRLPPLTAFVMDGVHRVAHRRFALTLAGAAAACLLITCTNLAALLLARTHERRKEMAVRRALGATRSRLIRQFLVEAAVLSGIGSALGTWVAVGVLAALEGLSLPGQVEVGNLDLSASGLLPVAVCLAMATAVLFGIAPAWRLA
jgi:putative ABC transport system permease protein